MNGRTRILCTGTLIMGCLALVLSLLPGLLHGHDSRETQPASAGKLVVHEWGTFTNFSGSDGLNLEFRPLVANDLPPFVFSPASQPGPDGRSPLSIFVKREYFALQRMETPVTYFYTDVPRTVNVRVDFPQGMLTEWFPIAKQYESGSETKTRPRGKAFLDWGSVRLLPQEQFAKVRLRGPEDQPVPAELPKVHESNHYGQARETDSAIVEVIDKQRGSHFEKFLFYRGLGDFQLPIKLVALGGDRFEVTNGSAEPSGAMLLVRIENEHVRFTRLDPIAARDTAEINLPTTESTVESLAEATVRELKAAGLYEKEALAMVNTWRSSWFGENGTRLLHLIGTQQTDALLPLTVEPAPDERVRILVGRLETLTPEDCQQLVGKLTSEADDRINAEAAKIDLGRFAEPAIRFTIGQTSDPATRTRLEKILALVQAP